AISIVAQMRWSRPRETPSRCQEHPRLTTRALWLRAPQRFPDLDAQEEQWRKTLPAPLWNGHDLNLMRMGQAQGAAPTRYMLHISALTAGGWLWGTILHSDRKWHSGRDRGSGIGGHKTTNT